MEGSLETKNTKNRSKSKKRVILWIFAP